MQQQDNSAQPKSIQNSIDPLARAMALQRTTVRGTPGLLTFDQIILLLSFAEVMSFNHRRNVELEFSATSFYVTTPGMPQYVFNEDAAHAAIMSGHLLWMPDAQGFGCTFELDCVVDTASLQLGGANG